jgi:hypothetical protein
LNSLQVYASGARNFLFLDVPPVQKSPMSMKVPTGLISEATSIKDWGSRLGTMSNNLRAKHPDATVIEFSTYKLFESILNNTKAYKQTSGLTILDTFCDGYSKSVILRDSFLNC